MPVSERAREAICDHRSSGGPTATHVRGALLASSLDMLRQVGVFDRYIKALPGEHHEQLLVENMAMGWIPMELAIAHYRACEAAAADPSELDRIAAGLTLRYGSSIVGTMLRTARQAGVDGPWVALRSFGRVWDRAFLGGGVRVYRTGPKDAYCEELGLPLSRISYFRFTHVRWVKVMGDSLTRRVFVRLVAAPDANPDTLAFTLSWA